MKSFLFLLILGSVITLAACFFRDEKPVVTTISEALRPTIPNATESNGDKKNAIGIVDKGKYKSLGVIARYFEKADAIHREAWWVMSSERRPAGKSPFGKIQRALLSSQNIKLSNKSIFRCDRYLVKRDVMKMDGFPQRVEIFEKCSVKIEAKKIAQFFAPNENEIQVDFFPENLEEILGLGATVLNKTIHCTLRGNDREQLISLKCQDWAQERSKEHLIRLDVYEYEMTGRNLIKLRGKVYENLSEARKLEADVPVDGKIFVTETEMYPPDISPEPPVRAVNPVVKPVTPAPVTNPAPAANVVPPQPSQIPPPREQPEVVDPDVLMQQQGPLQEWNPNEDIPQQPKEDPSLENPSPENPIPAGGVYGR